MRDMEVRKITRESRMKVKNTARRDTNGKNVEEKTSKATDGEIDIEVNPNTSKGVLNVSTGVANSAAMSDNHTTDANVGMLQDTNDKILKRKLVKPVTMRLILEWTQILVKGVLNVSMGVVNVGMLQDTNGKNLEEDTSKASNGDFGMPLFKRIARTPAKDSMVSITALYYCRFSISVHHQQHQS